VWRQFFFPDYILLPSDSGAHHTLLPLTASPIQCANGEVGRKQKTSRMTTVRISRSTLGNECVCPLLTYIIGFGFLGCLEERAIVPSVYHHHFFSFFPSELLVPLILLYSQGHISLLIDDSLCQISNFFWGLLSIILLLGYHDTPSLSIHIGYIFQTQCLMSHLLHQCKRSSI